MKIAVRAGHNHQATGAVGLMNEVTENRKVYKSVIKYLESAGHNVLDVTPNNCDQNTDLRYGVNKANNWGADLFISIHFDKCYNSYNGSLGTGTWVYGVGGNAEKYARNIVNSIANGTGLVNRGVKVNQKLYELRNTLMPSVIVEVCFLEATKDVEIYRTKGYDYIGKLIAEGINGKAIGSSNPSENNNSSQENGSNEGFYESNEKRTNATVVGQGNIPVLNKLGQQISNRYISSLDNVFVLGIYPSSKVIELVYPSSDKKYHAYIDIKYYNRLSFEHHMKYLNDGGSTYVWWNSNDVDKEKHNEELKPYQKASPMYRENGRLRVTFYRDNGIPSDGYLRYEGIQDERFYKEPAEQYGIVTGISSYLNVRNSPNGSIIGKVFPNEKVLIKWTESGYYYIEYNTLNGSKQGYASAKYINKI